MILISGSLIMQRFVMKTLQGEKGGIGKL